MIAESDLEEREELTSMLIECKFRGVRIQQAPDFYEDLNKKVWLEALWPGWFMLGPSGWRATKWTRRSFST